MGLPSVSDPAIKPIGVPPTSGSRGRAIGDHRRLAQELVRTAPAARSAGRRLKDLRRRAWVLQPDRARAELRGALLRVAGRVAGVGLRSLVAQAAPGVGAALRVVGVVGKLGRAMERDGGRGR
jgi:hypothetical protein